MLNEENFKSIKIEKPITGANEFELIEPSIYNILCYEPAQPYENNTNFTILLG
jgi:hypothetical protein